MIQITQNHTALSRKRAGDWVNLEADVFGKYVGKYLQLRHEQMGWLSGIVGDLSPVGSLALQVALSCTVLSVGNYLLRKASVRN